MTLQQSGLRHPDVIEIVKVSFALSAHFLRFERSSFASRAQSDVTFMFRNHIHCLSRVWLTQTFSDSNQGVNMSGLGKSVLFPQFHQQFIPSRVITFLTFAEVVKSSPVTKRVTKCQCAADHMRTDPYICPTPRSDHIGQDCQACLCIFYYSMMELPLSSLNHSGGWARCRRGVRSYMDGHAPKHTYRTWKFYPAPPFLLNVHGVN